MRVTDFILKTSWPERWLFVQATVSLLANSVRVHLLPYRFLEPRLREAGRVSPRCHCSVEGVVWAITQAARLVPGATCIVQALAGRTLLHRNGHPAVLRLGVAREADTQLAAHAWLELNGNIVMGNLPPFASYTPLEAAATANSARHLIVLWTPSPPKGLAQH